MKRTLIILLFWTITFPSCNHPPAEYASLSAPIAFALSRNALKQNIPKGEMSVLARWENLEQTTDDWPKGNIYFIITTPEYPNKKVLVQYILDGTHKATAIVSLPNGKNEQFQVNLYESAIIMGQSETIESFFAKLTNELSPRLIGRKVAVFDFQGINSEKVILGQRIAESLITTLVQSGTGVVERKLLEPVFKEINFQENGLTSQTGDELRNKIGNFLGADTIITGTLKNDKEEIVINARAVDIKSGIILATSQAVIPKYLFRSSDLEVKK